MSGVEFIVGTVLGGVPVAVLAFEKYQTLSTMLSTFRNPREIVRMQSKVGSQRTIFRNNAINLLSSVTNDRESIHSWISGLTDSSSHASSLTADIDFTLADVYRSRIDSLKDTFSSCKSTLDEIMSTLEKISEELSSIAKVVGKSLEPDMSQPSSSKEWLSRMGGRFKLALRKSDLSASIEDLRNLNSDFSVMTNQIVSTLGEIRNADLRNAGEKTMMERKKPKRTAININHIEAYQRIRQASNLLYDTLANDWTCLSREHKSHAASVSCIEPEQVRIAQPVKFEVALTVQEDAIDASSKQDHRLSGPLWIEVEYVDGSGQDQVAIVKTHGDHQTLEELSTALTKLSTKALLVAPSSSQNISKVPRKVRFDVVPGQLIPPNDSGTSLGGKISSENNDSSQAPPETASEIQVIDLMSVSDLCEHLHSQYRLCQSQQCFIGCLGGKQLQRFYIPPADRRVCDEPKSLEAIIAWIGANSMHRCLPLPVALQIAGSLAASVLQFHSTPWLPETWRSQDISFFSTELSVEDEIQLSHPHFQVQFSNHIKKSMSQYSKASDLTLVNSEEVALSGARNEILFRLGIVLLEVGFSRPWHSLREEVLNLKKLPTNRRTDYHVAEKLCAILMNQMGARYPRIIRKCIGCDFGLDEPQDDLEASEELQDVFLLDVVIELQQLKERVQGLG
ncbi:hypothetical protein B0J13DRAFT_492650 [Dactylonectria estremocensis]|uniref:DUF7580 domain-containing protein n=1 Tax=Dactylonectria estremocensis TaxID=1079267 RepID=A0A9P9JFK3_9HYPO|nr:hypothetical protein B0J13DRAFT_492650 [Dactylonectria estremocensis]